MYTYSRLFPVAICLYVSVFCRVGKIDTFSDKRAEGNPRSTGSFQARKEAGPIGFSLLVCYSYNCFLGFSLRKEKLLSFGRKTRIYYLSLLYIFSAFCGVSLRYSKFYLFILSIRWLYLDLLNVKLSSPSDSSRLLLFFVSCK